MWFAEDGAIKSKPWWLRKELSEAAAMPVVTGEVLPLPPLIPTVLDLCPPASTHIIHGH